MIKRIYIDNFRCFVNFEFMPKEVQLYIGLNGSGKTSVLHVVEKLRDVLVEGIAVDDKDRGFLPSSLTRWEEIRSRQTFELDVEGNNGLYRYHLEIDHDRAGKRCRIGNETLQFDNQTLYTFDGIDAHLFRDDPSLDPGPAFPYTCSRSFIASIPERKDNTKLTWFRNRMSRVLVCFPDPLRMTGFSEAEVEKPDRQLKEIASWLRHLLQEEAVDTMPNILGSLKEVLDGLVSFKLEKSSETSRTLKFEFKYENVDKDVRPSTYSLPLELLSEGQRSLVALFTILHASVRKDATVFIDEPDNFVALREIQPWLAELHEKAYDSGCQLGMISHHPEIANYLAANHGLLLFRDSGGPTRCKEFEWEEDDLSTPAELIARGWE